MYRGLPSGFAPQRQFDKVLLDAPCSGTGVMAKRADMRWQRDEDSIAQLCQLQVRCA